MDLYSLRRLCVIGFCFFLSLSQASGDLWFDDYTTTHSAEDSTPDGTLVFDNLADSAVFGGQRRLVADKAGPAGASRVSLLSNGFAGERLTFDQQGPSGTGAFGVATLVYDGDAAGTTDAVNPMIADTDFTAEGDRFVLQNLIVLGQGIDLTIDVFDGATISTFTVELAPQAEADFEIPFSAFSNASVFTSANALRLTFDGTETSGALSGRGSDLSFGKFSVTPEPTSFILAGFGMLGLVRVRRRREDKPEVA